ncbi:putative tRNA (guanine(26)-N(2))-dimethyltransferase 2, partial [Ananas comosus]
VDLDPYGSPVAFLDSVVQTLADGGLLMCTATDMAVLSGGNEGVCFSKYSSYPLKGKYCHEMALRILLACLESHANRHKRYIVPILSVQMDFYIRVFVRIFTSASAMKCSTLKLSYVYQCVGCDSFHMQSLGRVVSKNNSVMYAPGFGPIVPQECGDCGKKFSMGGPIWSAPIHDQDWLPSVISNISAMKDRYPAYERISALLTSVSEELLDVPLFVNAHSLCSTLKCTSPTMAMFRSALIHAGYRVSGSHIKIHPVKAHAASQPGTIILSENQILEANFAQPVDHLSKSRVKKLPRFLPNPERYWGPKSKAGRQLVEVIVNLSELLSHLLCELCVALLHGVALLGERSGLEEGDDLFLPIDAVAFFLEVHEWVARLAVPDVGEAVPVFTPKPKWLQITSAKPAFHKVTIICIEKDL